MFHSHYKTFPQHAETSPENDIFNHFAQSITQE